MVAVDPSAQQFVTLCGSNGKSDPFQSNKLKSNSLQGSLHYTPEHCLVDGGVPLFWLKKPCFKWAKCPALPNTHKDKEGTPTAGPPMAKPTMETNALSVQLVK